MKLVNEDLIKNFEALRLNAYLDTAVPPRPTIGWGHTLGVKMGDVITEDQAEAFFRQDVEPVEVAINKYVRVPLSQNQFDTLTSLAFNIGVAGFKGSTALARLNVRNYTGAAEAMTWWNKTGGKVSPGLVNRRAKEKAIFLTPDPVVEDNTLVDPKELKVEALMKEYTEKLMEIVNG